MKWIDLRDKTSSARLKSATDNGISFFFIAGLPNSNPHWQEAIDKLGFTASANRKLLIRAVRPGDRNLKVTDLQVVFPDAAYAEMSTDQVLLNLNAKPSAGASSSAPKTEEERDLQTELASAKRLGRNADGDEVYQAAMGRFIYREKIGITRETDSLRPAMFLYAPDTASMDTCADGFVKSLLMGEVQRGEDFDRFVSAVETSRGKPLAPASSLPERAIDRAHEAIDSATMRFLTGEYQTPNDAFGDSTRLYEYMPPYRGSERGRGAMPIPLSVIAQRLLGDTTGKTVILPNAFDGAAFSFLADGTSIRAFKGNRDLSERAKGLSREGLVWLDAFHHAKENNADAMFFNADPTLTNDGTRQDYRDALLAARSLAPDGRAVLVLAGDNPSQPGEMSAQGRKFLERLYSGYEVEVAFDVGRELTRPVGTNSSLRVISIRNRAPRPDTQALPLLLPTCHSWDEVKSRVDEALANAAIKERESDGIDLDKIAAENRLQRPYIAFSKVGEATTMVPKELQAPLQACMSDIEAQNGPIDTFVERELGFGEDTLAQRFSPEQVDAIAMMIARIKRGRGHILGDETGIGKGRALAALVTWAIKQDRPVVFVTDRANLFSDLARDLRDIGEWGRLRPLVMNSDGRIEDNIGDAGVLASGTPVADMRRILDNNVPLAEIEGSPNIVFTTYSQLSGADSEKAFWLKNQLKNALLVVDESHVAAGSDSNVATQISEMTQLAWGVQYSSATWAKSSENLHIYARALPASVNVATLAQTMRRGGDAFAEVFSGMLAREALIRREHDLSRLEFVVEVDIENAERNSKVADQVSEIMNALAYTSGDLKRLVTRMSNMNLSALREARDARVSGARTSLFKSRFGTGNMLYHVHRRVNAALNVKNAVRLVLEGVAAGRKPVIVFEDTGEAFVKQALEMQVTFDALGNRIVPDTVRPPLIKDLLLKMLDTLQMVKVEEVLAEDLPDIEADEDAPEPADGTEGQAAEAMAGEASAGATSAAGGAPPETGAPAADAHQVPVDEGITPEQAAAAARAAGLDDGDGGGAGAGVRVKKRPRRTKTVPFWDLENISQADRTSFKEGMALIADRIDALPPIPLNAPDEISRVLTESGIRVGELSGRSFSLQPIPAVEQPGGVTSVGLCRIIPRPKSKAHVNATVRAFNGGTLDVLMINRSAATGISLHASPRFADRRRRQLIELQIPENPTDRIQLYGRVNRYDQESYPLIQVATTGIYGELRQIMAQNKKLAEMSANIRSSRESYAVIDSVRDLLNVLGRGVCRSFLEENPEIVSRLVIDASSVEDGNRDFAQLLTSRIPLLRVQEQKQVYEQLYAMFDDAVAEADLAGTNPMKPNELDVRAKVGEAKLMFGFDHQGMGSAFDGAVFAQRLDWTEDVQPMSLEAMLAVIGANRERLVESGRVTKVGMRANGMINIDMSELAKRAAAQLDARVRLAVANTEMRKFRTFDEALAAARKPDAELSTTQKSMLVSSNRARWIEEHLPKLVPGRVVSMPRPGDMFGGQRVAVIVDIIPPPEKCESQLVRWRVLTLAPGEDKVRITTLNAMIGKIIESTLSDAPLSQRAGFFSTKLQIGGDFLDLAEATKAQRKEMRGTYMYEDFLRPFSGKREKRALVLTGNMYLASEWAAQTKAGNGIIFTDDRGMRHRGVLLQNKFKPEWLRYLPVRLWMPGMIKAFVAKLESGNYDEHKTVAGFKMHTSFDAAWNATSDKGEIGSLRILPGVGIVMNVGTNSRNRVNGMLRQAQKSIKEEVFEGAKVRPADDPGHVVIKEPDTKAARARQTRGGRDQDPGGDAGPALTRKDANFIILQANTPQKLARAVDMLMRGPGLELFVPATTPIGALAKSCMRDFFVQQLRADAVGDPVRQARIDEFIAREDASSTSLDTAETETESEIRRMFAALANRDRGEQAAKVDKQHDFDFEGGRIETPAESAVEEEPEPEIDEGTVEAPLDVNALFATNRGRRRAVVPVAGVDGDAAALPGNEVQAAEVDPEVPAPRRSRGDHMAA